MTDKRGGGQVNGKEEELEELKARFSKKLKTKVLRKDKKKKLFKEQLEKADGGNR